MSAGANTTKDWTFGSNIYDFSLREKVSQQELKSILPEANKLIGEGSILDIKVETHLTMLRNDVDYAVYSVFIPNKGVTFHKLSTDIDRFIEARNKGKKAFINVKVAKGKDSVATVKKLLLDKDVRAVTYQFTPEFKGTLVRMAISANFNPFAMLEAITKRKFQMWKEFPIFCDGYVQVPKVEGEVDLFATLLNENPLCKATGRQIEIDLFTGKVLPSGYSLSSEDGIDKNYPIDIDVFFTKKLKSLEELCK
jgi:hypothetical protein